MGGMEEGMSAEELHMRQQIQQQLHRHRLLHQHQHQQQFHHMQHDPNSVHMVAEHVPGLLLPVAPTSNEETEENDTIIKAANKAGYNVKRHLDALTFAKEIVARYKERGNVLPKEWSDTKNDPVREQEYKDAGKLRKWKQALKGGYRGNICAKEIREYLDEHMPAWRIDRKVKFRPTMQFVREIVERCQERGGILPRFVKDKSDPAKIQEFKDAQKLKGLRQGLLGVRKERCSDEVRDFLDEHIPQWRDRSIVPPVIPPGEKPPPKIIDPLEKARAIVERYHARGDVLPKEWSDRRDDPEREQEYKDAGKLRKWKQALKGIRSVSSICPDNVRDYLDKEMPTWRSDMNRNRKKHKLLDPNDLLEQRDMVMGNIEPSNTSLPNHSIGNEVVINILGTRQSNIPTGITPHPGHHNLHVTSSVLARDRGNKRHRSEYEEGSDCDTLNEEHEQVHRLVAESADI